MKITKKWLDSKNACSGLIAWWLKSKISSPKKLIKVLMHEKEYDYCNWLLVYLFDRKRYLKYVIFLVEQVLPIFEAKFQNDHRSRLIIQAVKNILKNDTEGNSASYAELALSIGVAYAVYEALEATYEITKMKIKILKFGIGLLNFQEE